MTQILLEWLRWSLHCNVDFICSQSGSRAWNVLLFVPRVDPEHVQCAGSSGFLGKPSWPDLLPHGWVGFFSWSHSLILLEELRRSLSSSREWLGESMNLSDTCKRQELEQIFAGMSSFSPLEFLCVQGRNFLSGLFLEGGDVMPWARCFYGIKHLTGWEEQDTCESSLWEFWGSLGRS